MHGRSANPALATAVLILTTLLTAPAAWAATEKKLHNFASPANDGAVPAASLIFDSAGNLYGTTGAGGDYGGGTVFELRPDGNGGWNEKVLYSFGNGNDGAVPAASLVMDPAGNLYGTTTAGGLFQCDEGGCGTVFELVRSGGTWTEKILHNFQEDGSDGFNPEAALIFDGAGNLYGTTVHGGDDNEGTAFRLSPKGNGTWTETTLHNFADVPDGANPTSPLIFDSAGNLYGTTAIGGDYLAGTVYELINNANGTWTEKKLHNFGLYDGDGSFPIGGLGFDSSGNLYGTTTEGGDYLTGTVFELSPNGSGGWTEKKLHNFGNGMDGQFPIFGGVVFDSHGNLYGSTYYGGDYSCGQYNCGTVFEMSPNGSGGWTEKKLHNFGSGLDGQWPVSGVIIDHNGNLYGTTLYGGDHQCDGTNCGTVFEIAP